MRLTVPTKDAVFTVNGTMKLISGERMQLSFLMPIIRTEVARMEVTPEEILLVDRMGKRYVRATRKELKDVLPKKADFAHLEKILFNASKPNGKKELSGKELGIPSLENPGAGANITIRGGMSLTQSTEPLYIVDGFEMGSALDNIDINDIESIDVLKDASSTAIYGARGSNGIILITTKSGKKGKTQVSYNTYFSFDKLAKKLDLMSNVEDFVKYQYEFAELTGITPTWSAFYDDGMATDATGFYTGVYDRIHERYADASSIDWQDEVFGGYAMTQSHNVNISTGTEKTQVMLS